MRLELVLELWGGRVCSADALVRAAHAGGPKLRRRLSAGLAFVPDFGRSQTAVPVLRQKRYTPHNDDHCLPVCRLARPPEEEPPASGLEGAKKAPLLSRLGASCGLASCEL